MYCSLFDICGGCGLPLTYEEQLHVKVQAWQKRFQDFMIHDVPFLIYPSPDKAFRARAEFGIFHEQDRIFYTLTNKHKQKIKISSCPILLEPITRIYPLLLDMLIAYNLSEKLFGVHFLSTLSGELLITLLYHRPLDEDWEENTQCLLKTLCQYFADKKLSIIGRSRHQKKVLGDTYVTEQFKIANRTFLYVQYEGTFSQPNPYINVHMIEWVCQEAEQRSEGDLLELYCGSGNFTIPLSQYYTKVLATEVSKISIKGLEQNILLNQITHIQNSRLHATEIRDALSHVRPFRRLSHVDLENYHFTTLFVDPPRSGLGEEMIKFAQQFKQVIYISCNPDTLLDDLLYLSQTHEITSAAVFDQFPYTTHLESALWLNKK